MLKMEENQKKEFFGEPLVVPKFQTGSIVKLFHETYK